MAAKMDAERRKQDKRRGVDAPTGQRSSKKLKKVANLEMEYLRRADVCMQRSSKKAKKAKQSKE